MAPDRAGRAETRFRKTAGQAGCRLLLRTASDGCEILLMRFGVTPFPGSNPGASALTVGFHVPTPRVGVPRVPHRCESRSLVSEDTDFGEILATRGGRCGPLVLLGPPK